MTVPQISKKDALLNTGQKWLIGPKCDTLCAMSGEKVYDKPVCHRLLALGCGKLYHLEGLTVFFVVDRGRGKHT